MWVLGVSQPCLTAASTMILLSAVMTCPFSLPSSLLFTTCFWLSLPSPLLGEWLVCAASVRGYHSPSMRTESIFNPSLCLSDMVGLYLVLWYLVLWLYLVLWNPLCLLWAVSSHHLTATYRSRSGRVKPLVSCLSQPHSTM